MAYKVVLWQNIMGKKEFTTTTLNISDGLITKGNLKTPIVNIKYIEEI